MLTVKELIEALQQMKSDDFVVLETNEPLIHYGIEGVVVKYAQTQTFSVLVPDFRGKTNGPFILSPTEYDPTKDY